MTNHDLNHYTPSDALHSIILRAVQDRFPSRVITKDEQDRIDQHISFSVRGLIATIGLGLSAEKGETLAMTAGSQLTVDVVKCYAFRLPVPTEAVPELMDAITKDLYKYAGRPAMVMESARLEVQNGELVVVGQITCKPREPSNRPRATVVRIG